MLAAVLAQQRRSVVLAHTFSSSGWLLRCLLATNTEKIELRENIIVFVSLQDPLGER